MLHAHPHSTPSSWPSPPPSGPHLRHGRRKAASLAHAGERVWARALVPPLLCGFGKAAFLKKLSRAAVAVVGAAQSERPSPPLLVVVDAAQITHFD